MRKWPFAALLLPLLAIGLSSTDARYSAEPTSLAKPADTISLLTYNVAALPAPIGTGRTQAAAEIAARLRAMRARGAAPDVVVLQEVFTAEARAALLQAGYRYAADGGDADLAGAPLPGAPDPAFAAERSRWAGETDRPVLDSGLLLLSDHPILSIGRAAFPRDACAGYDCLANKGVLVARIDAPGAAEPVEIVTTHLNAGRKSGASRARSGEAHRRQLLALDQFLALAGLAPGGRIVAGDFNVSHSAVRLARLLDHARTWGTRPAAAMGKAHHAGKCSAAMSLCDALPLGANVPLIHATDWQFSGAGRGRSLAPLKRTVLFGPDREGRMPSDHIGYAVTYALAPRT